MNRDVDGIYDVDRALLLAIELCPVCPAKLGSPCMAAASRFSLKHFDLIHQERLAVHLKRLGRDETPIKDRFYYFPFPSTSSASFLSVVAEGSPLDIKNNLYTPRLDGCTSPKFTYAERKNVMIQSSLKEKSILVDFDGGYYDWHRRDKSVEKDVGDRAGVNRGVGRYQKNIFHGNDQLLHSLRQVVQHARQTSEGMTLPWHPSRRLLLNINFLRHQQEMAKCCNALDTLFGRLEEEWDMMVDGAKAALGPLYNPDNYPSLSDVMRSTYIRATFYPMADASDVRLRADEEMVEAIRKEVTANEQKLYNDAVFGVWERLHTILENANQNLRKRRGGNSRFRTEWLGHLQSLAPVLKGLNLNDDPRLDRMAINLEDLLQDKTLTEDRLKQSGAYRDRIADDVDRIYRDVAAIFGPMKDDKEGA